MKKILSMATTLVVVATFTMISVIPAAFAQGNGNGKGNAYGHFIAPGWLKKHDKPSTDGISLPAGIAKKINNGGPGNSDTVPPIISSLAVTETDTTALVTWNTNESASSKVYVGTTSPVDTADANTMIFTSGGLVASHSVSVTGLSPSTTYYALVTSVDGSNNISTSSQFSFTTDATPDTTSPILTNIVVDADNDSVLITWDTNEVADSAAYISATSPVDTGAVGTKTTTDASLVTHHSLTVTGLEASTTYHLLVRSSDGDSNTSTSSEVSFVTDVDPDVTNPIISNVTLDLGTTTTSVDWSTDELATSVGYLSTTTGFGILDPGVVKVQNLSLLNSHTISFAGLNASTTYYLRVSSTDASANTALSNEISFTTL